MAYRLIIIIIAVVFLCRYSLMRLFGRFIVSAQTQPLIEAFVPFRHDGMITSCTKTCQRAGRRRQNELIFCCCCSHTTPTTTGTGLYFHTGSHFFYKRQNMLPSWLDLSPSRPTSLGLKSQPTWLTLARAIR